MNEIHSLPGMYFYGFSLALLLAVSVFAIIILWSFYFNDSTKAEFRCKLFGFTIETKRPARRR